MPLVPASSIPKAGITFTVALGGLLLALGVRPELAAAIAAMVVPLASIVANVLPADTWPGRLAHALAWNAETVTQPGEVMAGRIRALQDEVVRLRDAGDRVAAERDHLKALLHGRSASSPPAATPIGRTKR